MIFLPCPYIFSFCLVIYIKLFVYIFFFDACMKENDQYILFSLWINLILYFFWAYLFILSWAQHVINP